MTDLSAPLTTRKARMRATLDTVRRRFPVARATFGLAALVALIVVSWALLVHDPDGGRPSTIVAISKERPANLVVGANATPGPTPSIIVEDEFPVEAPAAVPEAVETSELLAPGDVIPDLVEETEFGPIPRISGSGLRPFDAYATPSDTPATAGGRPLVAIVVSGLGLNHDDTMRAISTLPDAVTFAFAPYGKTLNETVPAARAGGHEVFLEVPLEPFDYPENDPGPDTLVTGASPRENLQRLFKVMSRFGGYVGIINNMGARFTASAADFAPMMEQVSAAGLGYLDDGTSNRSLAPQLAEVNRVPFNRVDRILDLNPSRAAIFDELNALVDTARKNGSAIGIISALPVSINTITEWANQLGDVEIVPASALMRSPDA